MGNDECGPALHKVLKCVANSPLGLCVNCTRCIVQNQDRRIFYDCACNCQTLPLASRKGRSLPAHNGVVPPGEGHDAVMDVGSSSRMLDLFFRYFSFGSIPDVIPNGAPEEERLLLYDPDVAAQDGPRIAGQIHSVQVDVPGRGIIEPVEPSMATFWPGSAVNAMS